MSARFVLSIAWIAAFGIAAAGRAQTAGAACAGCHDQDKKMAGSAHKGVSCAACHARHEEVPHPAGLGKPACLQCHERIARDHAASVHGVALKQGNAAAPQCEVCHGAAHEIAPARSAEFRTAVPETCGMCHDGVAREFRASVHGKALAEGVLQAPVCTDCHGEHSIQPHRSPSSTVHVSHIRVTCAGCHENVRLARKFGMPLDRVVSFDNSFHGLAAKSGSQTVANCASCHGFHNILPSSDPKSTVHSANLPATCGRCHKGASARFALGPVHLWEGHREPPAVAWVRRGYLLLIPLIVGLMVLHNGGDWLRKLFARRVMGRPRRMADPSHAQIRMLRFERLLHALLASSFLLLAITGFQLTHPDQWWARPFLQWETTVSARGIVHRAAAAVFLATGLLHVLSLIFSPLLRKHWMELWPVRGDLSEALASFAYNLGLSSRKPRISPYSFIEKAEYWAVVWGGVVMGASGAMLWANSWFLARVPKAWLDVATALHFYEAVLACAAIAVWHFYMVIFDPDVYPVDTAMVTGVSVREHDHDAARAAHATR